MPEKTEHEIKLVITPWANNDSCNVKVCECITQGWNVETSSTLDYEFEVSPEIPPVVNTEVDEFFANGDPNPDYIVEEGQEAVYETRTAVAIVTSANVIGIDDVTANEKCKDPYVAGCNPDGSAIKYEDIVVNPQKMQAYAKWKYLQEYYFPNNQIEWTTRPDQTFPPLSEEGVNVDQFLYYCANTELPLGNTQIREYMRIELDNALQVDGELSICECNICVVGEAKWEANTDPLHPFVVKGNPTLTFEVCGSCCAGNDYDDAAQAAESVQDSYNDNPRQEPQLTEEQINNLNANLIPNAHALSIGGTPTPGGENVLVNIEEGNPPGSPRNLNTVNRGKIDPNGKGILMIPYPAACIQVKDGYEKMGLPKGSGGSGCEIDHFNSIKKGYAIDETPCGETPGPLDQQEIICIKIDEDYFKTCGFSQSNGACEIPMAPLANVSIDCFKFEDGYEKTCAFTNC